MIYFTFDWVFQVGVQSLNVVLLSGVEEEGNVAADRQGDFNRGIQRVLAIVLRNAAADLSGAEADYRVGIGVVVGNPVEDFNAEGALLEDIQIVGQGFFHHVLEQGWVATAAAEVGAGQNPLQLELDGLAVASEPGIHGCRVGAGFRARSGKASSLPASILQRGNGCYKRVHLLILQRLFDSYRYYRMQLVSCGSQRR
jgi:hypothetical protein